MSSRHLRKIREQLEKAVKEPEESDDDYQPLYARQAASKFSFDGLQLSSSSEVELNGRSSNSEEDELAPAPVRAKKNNKKKKKKQKKAQKSSPIDGEEDEIDKMIKEINDRLGSPAPAPEVSESTVNQGLVPDILIVQQKHLNVSNELKRKFGTDGEERRRVQRLAQLRIQKKSLLIPTVEQAAFQRNGLSMSVLRREGGYVYFTFNHDEDYRRRHQHMMLAVARGAGETFEDAQHTLHVEAMIEKADFLFLNEASSPANTLIEMAITYMQYVAHPSFQLTAPQTRLPYQYMENRPFHIAVLKYVHLLTNRACHRTALELAKMLLNLDPTDPLAVLFIIDTLALRAREHQWLIEAIDYWDKERDAGYLFNMKYSHALAHYHVALKNGDDLSAADERLQDTIMRFPSFVLKVLSLASIQPDERVRSCPFFVTADDRITKKLKDLIFLHAQFTWPKWCEPNVIGWLQRNAKEVAEKYDSDHKVQERAHTLSNQQLNLFRSLPDEIVRHLCVISAMSQLLVDGAVPTVSFMFSSDPVPPKDGANRYKYSRDPDPAARPSSALRDLFTSLLPTFTPATLDYVLDEERNNPALEMEDAYAEQSLDDDSDSDDFEINFDSDVAVGEQDWFIAVVSLARTVARAAGPRDPRPETPE